MQGSQSFADSSAGVAAVWYARASTVCSHSKPQAQATEDTAGQGARSLLVLLPAHRVQVDPLCLVDVTT